VMENVVEERGNQEVDQEIDLPTIKGMEEGIRTVMMTKKMIDIAEMMHTDQDQGAGTPPEVEGIEESRIVMKVVEEEEQDQGVEIQKGLDLRAKGSSNL